MFSQIELEFFKDFSYLKERVDKEENNVFLNQRDIQKVIEVFEDKSIVFDGNRVESINKLFPIGTYIFNSSWKEIILPINNDFLNVENLEELDKLNMHRKDIENIKEINQDTLNKIKNNIENREEREIKEEEEEKSNELKQLKNKWEKKGIFENRRINGNTKGDNIVASKNFNEVLSFSFVNDFIPRYCCDEEFIQIVCSHVTNNLSMFYQNLRIEIKDDVVYLNDVKIRRSKLKFILRKWKTEINTEEDIKRYNALTDEKIKVLELTELSLEQLKVEIKTEMIEDRWKVSFIGFEVEKSWEKTKAYFYSNGERKLNWNYRWQDTMNFFNIPKQEFLDKMKQLTILQNLK